MKTLIGTITKRIRLTFFFFTFVTTVTLFAGDLDHGVLNGQFSEIDQQNSCVAAHALLIRPTINVHRPSVTSRQNGHAAPEMILGEKPADRQPIPKTFDDALATLERWRQVLEKDGIRPDALPKFYSPDLKNSKRPQVFVLVHGIGESPAGMDQLAKYLTARGNNVLTILLDGHGGTDPARLHGIDNSSGWEANVHSGLQIAKQLGDQTVLVGFSMGGALATNAAVDHPELVDSLGLLNPALHTSDYVTQKLLERIAANKPYSRDEEITREQNPYTYPQVSMGAFTTYLAFSQGLRMKTAAQKEFPVPVTILISEGDRVIDLETAAIFAGSSGGNLGIIPTDQKIDHVGIVRPPGGFLPEHDDFYHSITQQLLTPASPK